MSLAHDTANTRAAQIAALNDAFRAGRLSGHMHITRGVAEKGAQFIHQALRAVLNYRDFDQGNDPWSERDFGALNIKGERLFWKIDYYDPTLRYGSDDPADATRTARVITIMLASEY